jgi:hypothetical protein
MPAAVTKDSLTDVEDLLYHGCLEEDVFLAGHALSMRTLSTAEERELWICYKNVAPEDQVHFVLDLLSLSLHRVNGRRLGNRPAAREFLWRLPRTLILRMYRLYRGRLTGRVRRAQESVDEYTESSASRSLWGAFKVTGALPSPDFDFRNSNVVQHLWLVVNHYRDEADAQKSAWRRAEFVADQICMFLDPKGFRQMRARRESHDARARQKEYDAEVDVLVDILEMMLPEDRLAFADGVRSTDPQDLTVFLDRLPRRSLESTDEYKGRVCEALARACDALDREDTTHARVIQEKSEAMVVGFLREQRARLALRNLRLLLEVMGAGRLETATRRQVLDEVDFAVAERGQGYALRSADDAANYGPVMRCEGVYKHVAFVPPARRGELLAAVLAEDVVALALVIDPAVDAYLLRKANSDADVGPRGGPPPPTTAPPTAPPTAPAARSVFGEPAGRPEPASQRPDLADLVHQMAEEYRQRNPGVEGVARRIEVGDHVVETLGDWEDAGRRKVMGEPPASVDEASEAARRRSADSREYGLEEAEQGADRRDSALGRRNDALEELNRAKRRAGVTPEMEREAFMGDLWRIAQGQPPQDAPEPPRPKSARPGEGGG